MLIHREVLLTQCLHLVNQRIISFIIWRRCNINYLCASGGSFLHSRNIGNNFLNSYDSSYRQKQPSRGVLKKRCFENMQQIYMRTPMPKCDFNKVTPGLWSLFFFFNCLFSFNYLFRFNTDNKRHFQTYMLTEDRKEL